MNTPILNIIFRFKHGVSQSYILSPSKFSRENINFTFTGTFLIYLAGKRDILIYARPIPASLIVNSYCQSIEITRKLEVSDKKISSRLELFYSNKFNVLKCSITWIRSMLFEIDPQSWVQS